MLDKVASKFWNDYYKVVRIIDSCKDGHHLDVASKMCKLLYDHYIKPRHNDKQSTVVSPEWIHLKQHFNDKVKELHYGISE